MTKTKPDSEKTGGTQLLDRAIAILDTLGDAGMEGMRTADLAADCDLNLSTAHRIISSLEGHGFVERIAGTKKVRLGLTLFSLGTKAADSAGFRRVCHPALLRIAAKTGDMVFLMGRSGFNTVCVDRQEGSYLVGTLTGQIGGQIPLGIGPASQAILAFLPSEDAETIIRANEPQYQNYKKLTADTVLNRLPEIRRSGYALDHGYLIEGISALAMPICPEELGVVGALSINMTSARMKPGRLEDLLSLLRREIAGIEELIHPRDVIRPLSASI